MLSPDCVISYQPYYLDVVHYARGNKTANLLNNQTKSVKESNDRFGLSPMRNVINEFPHGIFHIIICTVAYCQYGVGA